MKIEIPLKYLFLMPFVRWRITMTKFFLFLTATDRYTINDSYFYYCLTKSDFYELQREQKLIHYKIVETVIAFNHFYCNNFLNKKQRNLTAITVYCYKPVLVYCCESAVSLTHNHSPSQFINISCMRGAVFARPSNLALRNRSRWK